MKAGLQIFNYQIANQINGSLDIHIDGDIVDAPTQEIYKNFWGDETSVSFRSFRNSIEEVRPTLKTVNIYTNSTGGHVGDAMAMHDYLEELESKGVTVNRIGRGIIASAATYLIIGKNSSMTKNSMAMIHNISLVVMGDINVCENQVKAGRKFNNLIRDFYASATNKPAETIASWMNKETWFTADEFKANGFIKNVTSEAKFTNKLEPEYWPFQNTEILNTYNSQFKTNEDMDIKKVTDAIENGFSKFFGNSLPEKFKLPDNAAKEFAEAIANSLKTELLTEERITEIANKAVEDATKDDATELGKVFVNKSEMEALKVELIKNIGNKSTGDSKEETKGAANPKNRFSGRTFFNEAK